MSRTYACLLGLLVATTLVRAQHPEARLLEEARNTILRPFSPDAKTASLGLSAEATHLIDIWLDFCRNRWEGRAFQSEIFRGMAQSEWLAEGGAVTLRLYHGDLTLEASMVGLEEAPALLAACWSEGFVDAVRVKDDHVELIPLWAVALSAGIGATVDEAVRLGKQGLDREAWTRACDAATQRLVAMLPETPPLKELHTRGVVPSARRKVYIEAIGVLGGERAGPILKEILDTYRKQDNAFDTETATRVLAGTHGPEATACALTELESGDERRMLMIIEGVGPRAAAPVVAKVAAVIEGGRSARLTFPGTLALRRAAAPGSASESQARQLFLGFVRGLSNTSMYKLVSLEKLAEVAAGDEKVVAYLVEERARLRASYDGLSERRKQRMDRLLASLDAAIGA